MNSLGKDRDFLNRACAFEKLTSVHVQFIFLAGEIETFATQSVRSKYLISDRVPFQIHRACFQSRNSGGRVVRF